MSSVTLRVKEILNEKGMSVLAFSQKSGLNYRTALSLVHGKYDRIGLSTIAKICDALSVEPKDIFVHVK